MAEEKVYKVLSDIAKCTFIDDEKYDNAKIKWCYENLEEVKQNIKKYDKESQCVVYAFYFDGGDEKEDDSKTLEGPFIPNFHD